MGGGTLGEWLRRFLVVVLFGIGMAGCAGVERDQYGGEFLDDSVITARVKTRLAQELGSASVAISVETHNRVVLLSGFIDDPTHREKALATARGVVGARDVNGDGLLVRPQRPSN